MQMGGRILVPVDGSDTSLRAVAFAACIARATEACIDLLYVSYFDEGTEGDPDAPTWLEGLVPRELSADELFQRVERELDGIRHEEHRRTGTPAHAILAFAEEAHTSLIVMGGRGLSPVKGFLLGSVSQEVMESFAGTVLIVK